MAEQTVPAAGTGAEDNGTGTVIQPEVTQPEVTEPVSFDDFLKDKSNQAEFDRRVNKAVQTGVKNAEEKWKILTDDKLSEAEKLAKMTKEEKTRYENEQLKSQLAALKRQSALVDITKTARKLIADEGVNNVPDDLVSCLVSDDAEKTKSTVQSFTGWVKDLIQAGVKDALKGNAPKAGAGSGSAPTRAEIENIKNGAERRRMISENMDLFI